MRQGHVMETKQTVVNNIQSQKIQPVPCNAILCHPSIHPSVSFISARVHPSEPANCVFMFMLHQSVSPLKEKVEFILWIRSTPILSCYYNVALFRGRVVAPAVPPRSLRLGRLLTNICKRPDPLPVVRCGRNGLVVGFRPGSLGSVHRVPVYQLANARQAH